MAEVKRAIVRERETWPEAMQEQSRMKSTLVIAAAIIAAVRLARDPDISRPKPDA
jgi:3-deoxy-D-manno-octulosonic-acid transferase